MSPVRQPNRLAGGRTLTRKTSIDPALRTARNAIGPSLVAKKRRNFDPHAFLAIIGEGRKSVLFPKKHTIFAQGDTADAVFYIQTGKIKLTVVSKTGKEATIAILTDGDFFGEGSLAGQPLRMGSATAMTDCAILRIDKKAMMEALHREHEVSDMFVAYLLARNIRYEEDLVDQLLIRAKNGWPGSFCCSLILARKAKPNPYSPKSIRQPWRKWSAQPGRGSVIS